MTDFLGYRGRNVIVSGCTTGMGEATARILVEQGARVHGLDYKPCALELASFQTTDLRDPQSIDAAVAGIEGGIDALFNCAGLPHTFPPMDVMKVNFIGTRYLTDRVLPRMSEGGAIVSIASTRVRGWAHREAQIRQLLAQEGFEAMARWCEDNPDVVREGYSFSKEAIILWTFLLSAELIKRGIRINCTTPGPTQTPMMKELEIAATPTMIDFSMQPINRRSTPEEQARPLIFLNSDAASYVNGVCFPVDGGFMAGVASGTIDLTPVQTAARQ